MALLTVFGARRTRVVAAALVAAGIGIGTAGCLGLDVAGTFRWPGSKSDQVQAARMTVVWKNDIQKKAAKNVLRGFQGKVQFFAADPPKAPSKDGEKKPEVNAKGMTVEGTLTVYAFEETPDGKQGSGPSKKYVFPAKDLKKVQHDGPQGHEYEIWLAWDKVGGPERHIRLLVRFDPAGGGQVVMSENSRETLPGLTVQYAGQPPATRKAPPDSSGRPVSEADFETNSTSTRDSKPAANAAAPSFDDTH
jgi:hypothetical protein